MMNNYTSEAKDERELKQEIGEAPSAALPSQTDYVRASFVQSLIVVVVDCSVSHRRAESLSLAPCP